MATARVYPAKKVSYFEKMNQYLDDYERIICVSCDNVSSKQFNTMRIGLRPSGEYPFEGKILMGKNSMMKKALKDRAAADPTNATKQLQMDKFKTILKGNIGLLFTNDDLAPIADMIEANVKQAPAKVGAVAPCDVHIKAGQTSLEPGQTSFFQALNIHTKITKGNIEILSDVHLIKEGERVGPSEAILLKKMGQNPFFYGLKIMQIYDHGSFYSPAVLKMTEESKAESARAAINAVAALSLGTGFTTEASFPHVAVNAFKNIFSLSLGTDYDFEAFGAKQLKQDIKEGKITAAPAAAEAPAAAAPAPVEESDDDMDGDFGLFD